MLPGGSPLPTQLMTGMAADGAAYTDFGALAELRASARSDAGGSLEEVASQFESMFIHMMLKSMRATTQGDPLLGSGGRMFTQMFDQQLSLEMARTGSFGLAEVLVRQLQHVVPGATQDGTPPVPVPVSDASVRTPVAAAPVAATPVAATPVAAIPGVATRVAPPSPATNASDGSPRAFVESVWAHARKAGEALGLNPRVLVAQAALETGWGRSVIHDGSGHSSNNFFGIKADRRWQGPRVEVPTLEYQDGVLTKMRAPFRAYDSIAQSFADYVDFVRTQPRYQDAVANAASPERYVRELQAAGYATDPDYATKILSIFKRPELGELMQRFDLQQGGVHGL